MKNVTVVDFIDFLGPENWETYKALTASEEEVEDPLPHIRKKLEESSVTEWVFACFILRGDEETYFWFEMDDFWDAYLCKRGQGRPKQINEGR